jgi:peptidoglycan/xylan/chitin deacetylase (PgdA/CDA1 family)
MTRVTLSFDNGPSPGITDHVLDVLKAYSVKATFFLVGSRLQAPEARDLAERARREGHWIGNHTLTHGAPLGERPDPETARREIGNMDALLGELIHEDRLFRPNGRGKIGPHLLSPPACDFLLANKSTVVLWTHVPKDRGVAADAWVADAQRASLETDWPLLVLHDRPSGHDLPASSMTYLESYIKWASNSKIEITQSFPKACLPISRGRVCLPLEPYLRRETGAAQCLGLAP